MPIKRTEPSAHALKHYTRADQTNVANTFARVRAEMARAQQVQQRGEVHKPLPCRPTTGA